jgi:hypothetical protein
MTIDGSVAQYELSKNECVTTALCNQLAAEARDAHVGFVELLVNLDRLRDEMSVAQDAGFQYAGTQQINRDGGTQTFAVFRAALKGALGSADGTLALDPPRIAPSREEQQAIELMKARYRKPQ